MVEGACWSFFLMRVGEVELVLLALSLVLGMAKSTEAATLALLMLLVRRQAHQPPVTGKGAWGCGCGVAGVWSASFQCARRVRVRRDYLNGKIKHFWPS